LVGGHIFLENWAGEFTDILLNNLSSSIGNHVLVGCNVIDNQRDGWIPLEVEILGALFRRAEDKGCAIPRIPDRGELRSPICPVDAYNGVV